MLAARQARRERREAERKAKKAETRRIKAEAPVGFVSQTAASPSKRAEINRANAQHSTGPSSPTGKLASSRNSLKHGLASGTLLIPGEDPAAFESLLHDLLEEHQPANTTEDLLVHDMAQSFWLAQRAIRLQNDCFTPEVNEKRLSLYLRYQSTHDRAFHKALNTLIRLRKERSKLSSGFVSQSTATNSPNNGFVSQPTPADPHNGFVSQKRDEAALLSEPKTQEKSPQNELTDPPEIENSLSEAA